MEKERSKDGAAKGDRRAISTDGDSTTELLDSFALLDSNLVRPYSTKRYSFKQIFLRTFLKRTNRAEASKRALRARYWAADASYSASLE